MMVVDVIILSCCKDEETYRMNLRCLHSLEASEPMVRFNIILVESFADFDRLGFSYPMHPVTLVQPKEPFHFNRFLNIGLAQATQPWVVFSNNDVIFHTGWLSEIFRVKLLHPWFRSFCPFDRTSPYLPWKKYKRQLLHIGYRVPVEFVGWCFVIERAVFNETGTFDEQFDLYFQDNDFARTLQQHAIPHAMVPASFVEHIGGYTTQVKDASKTEKYALDKMLFNKKWNNE